MIKKFKNRGRAGASPVNQSCSVPVKALMLSLFVTTPFHFYSFLIMTNKESINIQIPSTMTTMPPSTTVPEYKSVLQPSEYEELFSEFFKSMTPKEVTEHLTYQHCAATRNEHELDSMCVAQDIAANGCISGFIQAVYEIWMRQKLAQMHTKQ